MHQPDLDQRHSVPHNLDEQMSLKRSYSNYRTASSFVLSTLTLLATLIACIPLFSVLFMLAYRGGKQLSLELFTQLPPSAYAEGGGFGNAIVGTMVMVFIATGISVPFGVLAAIFLAELGPDSRTAGIVRFCAKVLTGFPSILCGVFVYTAVVLLMGFSALAGGIALSILMLPVVMLTTEEALLMVPAKMKEGAIGMGATRTQVIWKIVIPTALPGILTGVMLGVARAAGETAPLLLTANFSNYWILQNGDFKWHDQTASLAVLIWNFHNEPAENLVEMAWAAALVLVLMVLCTNLLGQALSSEKLRSWVYNQVTSLLGR